MVPMNAHRECETTFIVFENKSREKSHVSLCVDTLISDRQDIPLIHTII